MNATSLIKALRFEAMILPGFKNSSDEAINHPYIRIDGSNHILKI
jgi:hypothetical protein